MSLQSEFLRGDRKLEAAAVSDSAHIVLGSAGPHVRKIQLALFVLDGAFIASGEIVQSLFGRSTARAVLAYKQRRRIVNTAYQSQADNIVGKMTIASLDKELIGKRLTTGIARCDYAPESSGSRLGFSLAVSPGTFRLTGGPGPSTSITPLRKALNTAPEAIQWARDAIQALDVVIDSSVQVVASSLGFQALVRHYKPPRLKDVETAKKVKDNVKKIVGVLGKASSLFVAGLGSGFAETDQPPSKISIMPGYDVCGKLMGPTVLIHESFHFIDQFNQDFGGNPVRDNGAKYHQNPVDIQLVNAYAMSQFVLHIHEKQEKFLNDSD